MQGNERAQFWVKILIPMIPPIIGALIGGGITWGIAQNQIVSLNEEVAAIHQRIDENETSIEGLKDDRVFWTEKFTRLEVKMENVVDEIQRLR